jgi:hypothetical protein
MEVLIIHDFPVESFFKGLGFSIFEIKKNGLTYLGFDNGNKKSLDFTSYFKTPLKFAIPKCICKKKKAISNLKTANNELERFNKLFTAPEFRIKELNDLNRELKTKLKSQ